MKGSSAGTRAYCLHVHGPPPIISFLLTQLFVCESWYGEHQIPPPLLSLISLCYTLLPLVSLTYCLVVLSSSLSLSLSSFSLFAFYSKFQSPPSLDLIANKWRSTATSVVEKKRRCFAPPTRQLSATPATTGSTTPTNSPPSTSASLFSTPPLSRSLSATYARWISHFFFFSFFVFDDSVFWLWVVVVIGRRRELSYSVSRTEQFYVETAIFQFTPPTSTPRSTTGSFSLASSFLPLLRSTPLPPASQILFPITSLSPLSRSPSRCVLRSPIHRPSPRLHRQQPP